MHLSKRYLNTIKKYKDTTYLNRVPKYVISNDLKNIGIDIKPCYDLRVLRSIMKVLVEDNVGV